MPHASDSCCAVETWIIFKILSLRLWSIVWFTLTGFHYLGLRVFNNVPIFVLSDVLGKQNSSALKSETTTFLTAKIDEDAIAPQEISKDGCDSASSSDSSMDFEGISWYLLLCYYFPQHCFSFSWSLNSRGRKLRCNLFQCKNAWMNLIFSSIETNVNLNWLASFLLVKK